MNNKTKYLLSLVAVLLIGVFLGFLINGRLVKARVERLQESFTEQGFRYEFMRTLNPSPEQMEKIRPILMDYGMRNRENMIQYRLNQQDLMIHLQNELLPYLNKNQINRMQNMRNRWDRRFRRPDRFHRQHDNSRMGPGRMMMPGPPANETDR
ncbi:MAG: hypothetical protein JXR65_02680 [Bacteroidales bacterium]|nr:hypothetical protein [Bacteroidales bacterium]